MSTLLATLLLALEITVEGTLAPGRLIRFTTDAPQGASVTWVIVEKDRTVNTPDPPLEADLVEVNGTAFMPTGLVPTSLSVTAIAIQDKGNEGISRKTIIVKIDKPELGPVQTQDVYGLVAYVTSLLKQSNVPKSEAKLLAANFRLVAKGLRSGRYKELSSATNALATMNAPIVKQGVWVTSVLQPLQIRLQRQLPPDNAQAFDEIACALERYARRPSA